MKIKSVSVISFLSFSFCISCSSSVGTLPVIHPDESQEIEDITPYVKCIEEISFSESSDIIYASIQKLIVLPSVGFLALDIRKNVFLFAENGECIRRIGRIGRGSGEYVALQDIAFDTNTETILLLCLNEVIEYNLSGKYLATYTVPDFNYDAIASFDDGFCLFVATPNHSIDNLKTTHKMVHFYSREKGKVVNESFQRNDYVLNTELISFSAGMGYLIRPLEGDNILYKVKGNTLNKVMEVSFEKRQIPSKYLLDNGKYDISSFVMSPYFKMPMNFQFTQNHFFFTAIGPGGVLYYYLYNNDFSPIGFWKEPDNCLSPIKIASSDSDSFYILVNDPSYWREMDYNDADPLMKAVISNCALSGDNPLLLKLTLANLKQ